MADAATTEADLILATMDVAEMMAVVAYGLSFFFSSVAVAAVVTASSKSYVDEKGGINHRFFLSYPVVLRKYPLKPNIFQYHIEELVSFF